MKASSPRVSLPSPLRQLVSGSVAILGDVIRRELGERPYRTIESLRKDMAGLRELGTEKQYVLLRKRLELLRRLGERERREIAHAFTLMLELMNACEAAYRSFRIDEHESVHHEPEFKSESHITWVLTAHPTEARSPGNIEIFHRIQEELISVLRFNADHPAPGSRLRHLIGLAWQASVARNRKPSVEDEAAHIYSIALRPDVNRALLEASASLAEIKLRTWVGGDKDGHTGVDERTMERSLALSRQQIVAIALRHCLAARADATLARDRALELILRQAIATLRRLRRLARGEARTIARFAKSVRIASERSARATGAVHPALGELTAMLALFPALVVPLELRDARVEIGQAAQGENVAIRRMLRLLGALSRGGDPRAYAGSLIISMTEDVNDVRAALKLVRDTLGDTRLPVVPLLEKRSALDRAGELTRAMIRDPRIRAALKRNPGGTLEIMLGYSDSAKEIGVLASRASIIVAMREIEAACRGTGFTPLFFHGAGGSIDRGGGSIQEQTAGWPRDARRHYKVTIQGEMVERSLASREILRSQIRKITQSLSVPESQRDVPGPATRNLARIVSEEYRRKVNAPGFMDLVHGATAYRYLHELKIGSRPTKRAARGKTSTPVIESLRAIPWVLCWTQTRILFPTWWGVGTAWTSLGASERRKLRAEYKTDPLLRSFVKLLGFTLAKVELAVWRIYLEVSKLPDARIKAEFAEFTREYRNAVEFVHALSGERDLLWFRPWLGTSIELRSPMIHPLNLIQCLALASRDGALIRETVTGVSSGMMTTG